MDASEIISEDVVARVHSDHVRIVVMLGELRKHVVRCEDQRLEAVADVLAEALRDHMGLVGGILEALVPDDVYMPQPPQVARNLIRAAGDGGALGPVQPNTTPGDPGTEESMAAKKQTKPKAKAKPKASPKKAKGGSKKAPKKKAG